MIIFHKFKSKDIILCHINPWRNISKEATKILCEKLQLTALRKIWIKVKIFQDKKLVGECKQAESIRETCSRNPAHYDSDFTTLDALSLSKRNYNHTSKRKIIMFELYRCSCGVNDQWKIIPAILYRSIRRDRRLLISSIPCITLINFLCIRIHTS